MWQGIHYFFLIINYVFLVMCPFYTNRIFISTLTELAFSWDEQLGLKAIPEIFGLWVTDSAEKLGNLGGKSVGTETKRSSSALAICLPVACVS